MKTCVLRAVHFLLLFAGISSLRPEKTIEFRKDGKFVSQNTLDRRSAGGMPPVPECRPVLKNGAKGSTVEQLQEALNWLGCEAGGVDGDFGGNTDKALIRFQHSAGLDEDGDYGCNTKKELHAAMYQKMLKGNSSESACASKGAAASTFSDGGAAAELSSNSGGSTATSSYTVVSNNNWADKVENWGYKVSKNWDKKKCSPPSNKKHYDGFTSFKFRSDMSDSYQSLLDAVHANGGKLTSAGSLRALSAAVSTGRVPTSMHYTGIAFDMSIFAAGKCPDKDPYVLVPDASLGPRRWRLWFRSDTGTGPNVVTGKKLDAVVFYQEKGATRANTVETTGNFFDFTALALEHGWKGINCWKSSWKYLNNLNTGKGGSYYGLEFWHFQCESCISKGTKFGDVLKTIYSQSTIKTGFSQGAMGGRCQEECEQCKKTCPTDAPYCDTCSTDKDGCANEGSKYKVRRCKSKAERTCAKECKRQGIKSADTQAAESRWTKTKDLQFSGGGFR